MSESLHLNITSNISQLLCYSTIISIYLVSEAWNQEERRREEEDHERSGLLVLGYGNAVVIVVLVMDGTCHHFYKG